MSKLNDFLDMFEKKHAAQQKKWEELQKMKQLQALNNTPNKNGISYSQLKGLPTKEFLWNLPTPVMTGQEDFYTFLYDGLDSVPVKEEPIRCINET